MLKYHNLSCLSVILHIAVFFAVTYTPPVYGHEGDVISTVLTTKYQFQGVASGGSLILAESLNRNARFFSIETQAGEAAESVARRMAKYIDENNPFEWGGFQTGQKRVTAEGCILGGLIGGYMFAGTETGLGIPDPPLSVSCSYDQDKDRILLNWVNPTGGYDRIRVGMNWDRNSWSGGGRVQGQLTSFVIDRKSYRHPIDINDLYVYVIGFRNELPSNAGAIHVSSSGKVQEELFGIPFKNGVAPNWKLWVIDSASQNKIVEGLVRSDFVNTESNRRRNKPLRNASRKPFYQVIKTPKQGGTAGIWRKFLGLPAGHTYRISARVNSLEMDSAQGDWTFSLHAAHNGPSGSDLTTQQLAGLDALPDGNVGEKGGRIAAYGPGATSNGKWVKHSAEITLPAGVDTITVWVRHSGSDSTGVGIDWVKLEDLSMMSDKSGK